ncbi:MAG: AAA family ATPase [Acaryochloris sp. RU_4_1]|nr:AAA family ATPase [Acaryochloris sp. RU_4_1]
MPLSVSVRDIQTLILSYHPVIVIETLEEERVHTLLQQATQDMSTPLFEWSIAQGLIRSPGTFDAPWVNEYAPPGTLKPAAIGNTAAPVAVLKHVQDMTIKALFWLKDFGKHFEDAETARHFREAAQLFSQKRSAFILTGDNIVLPREIEHDAVFYDLKLPDRDELFQAVREVVQTMKHKHRTVVELQPEEMQALVQAMTGMTLKQARQVLAYAALDDGKLTMGDVDRILHRKTQLIRAGGILDYLPLEDNRVEWGGFANLKQWLARAQVGFSPAAKALNLSPPKGILIVGIQGCGKSLAAKAIAREWKMPLLKLDAGRLYDKYVGESEKNFRKAISLAESMSPAVLWIDEIEKSLGATGTDTDGGLSRRLFGSFLTWMQEKSQEVFVVATANDISQIPPELLRKGRFDEIFYVDLPDLQERGAILRIHLTLHKQDPRDFDLPTLLQVTEGYSGAEIEQAVIAALYRALYLEKPLDTDLLVQEIQGMIPLSVSRKEHLHQLRTLAQDRFINTR